MRITPDKPHSLIQKARNRRRVYLSLFSLFLVTSLLLLAYFGHQLSKRNNAANPAHVGKILQPNGELSLSLQPIPIELISPKLVESSENSQEQLNSILLPFYPVAHVYTFQPTESDQSNIAWLMVARVQRPQRLYHESLIRFAEGLRETSAQKGESIFSQRQGALFLASNDSALLESSLRKLRETPPEDATSPVEDELPAPLFARYQGPWGLAPQFLKRELGGALNAILPGDELRPVTIEGSGSLPTREWVVDLMCVDHTDAVTLGDGVEGLAKPKGSPTSLRLILSESEDSQSKYEISAMGWEY